MAGNTISLKLPKDFFKNYARDKPCQVRVARLAGHACALEETTVLCHPTVAGLKAMGSRKRSVPDIGAAWGCRVCHDICDGRIKTEIPPDTLNLYLHEGVSRTIDCLVKAGVLPNP